MNSYLAHVRGPSRLVRFAVTVLASAVVTLAHARTEKPEGKIFVASVDGDSQIIRDGKVELMKLKQAYKADGSGFETKPKGTNALVFSNGTGVYLDPDTRVDSVKFKQEPFTPNRNDLEVEPSVSQTDAMISHGTISLCTSKLVAGSTMMYRTLLGSVSMQPGKFVIEATSSSTTISVLEGEGLVRGGELDLGGHIVRGGEQAVITPGPAGSPSAVVVQKIPDGERSALDDKVFAACTARKTVFFDTSAQDPTNVIATPVVPPKLDPPITVSPSTLPR